MNNLIILKTISFLVVVICFSTKNVNSANVLAVFPTIGKSHLIIQLSAIHGLVERGHNVTVITNIAPVLPNPGYRHIQAEAGEFPPDTMQNMINLTKASHSSRMTRMIQPVKMFMNISDLFLKHENVQNLLKDKNEKFDLVVLGYIFSEFHIGLGAHFKCPIAIIWVNQPMAMINNMIGNPLERLYVPMSMMMDMKPPLSFFNRIKNVLSGLVEDGVTIAYDYAMESYYNENFPSNQYPSYRDAYNLISLVLVSHHFSLGGIRPNVPAYVEINGIQIKEKPNPLPKVLKEKMENASKNGVIYFCLGTAVRSSDIEPEITKRIFKVLSNVDQQVIWKWDGEVSIGSASNIYTEKWLPQDDILAHPNVKLFITHGGKGGISEAEYHGVPMVGLPVFGDQVANMQSVVDAGFGISVDIHSLTEEIFKETINEVLTNQTYRENVKKFFRIYRDRPQTPKEAATFWMEYVIRHRGAPHMQSPYRNLNFLQKHGVDVFAFIILVLYVVWKIVIVIIKFLWNSLKKLAKIKRD